MKLSEKSLNNYYQTAGETLNHYMSMDKETLSLYHVSISTGNEKLKDIPNVSTLPVYTCGNCDGCRNYCYAVRSALQYKNCRNSWAKNTAIACRDTDRFFSEISSYIEKKHCTAFRFHVAGEINNLQYLHGMINVALRFPFCQFCTYTKRFDILESFLNKGNVPENFHILLSTGFHDCDYSKIQILKDAGLKEFRFIPKNGMPLLGFTQCISQTNKNLSCGFCRDNKVGCYGGKNLYAMEH